MKLELPRQIFEKLLNIKLNKIRPVRVELLHTKGRPEEQTDMMKPIVVFADLPTRVIKRRTWTGHFMCRHGLQKHNTEGREEKKWKKT
jgi:hypothetical protein